MRTGTSRTTRGVAYTVTAISVRAHAPAGTVSLDEAGTASATNWQCCDAHATRVPS
jgi:hypothetical protein